MLNPRPMETCSGRFWCKQTRSRMMAECNPSARLKHYSRDGISTDRSSSCVSAGYTSFKLSFRDLVIMMADRGITLTHTTILRWGQHYLPEFEKRWSR